MADGYAGEVIAFLQLQPVPGRPAETRSVTLHAPAEPKAVWADGAAVRPAADGVGRWRIPAGGGSHLVALFADPPSGVDPLAAPLALCRAVDRTTKRDLLRPDRLADGVVRTQSGFRLVPPASKVSQLRGESQIHLAVRAPTDGDGVLRLVARFTDPAASAGFGCRLNGKPVKFAASDAPADRVVDIPLKAGEAAHLGFALASAVDLSSEWLARVGAAVGGMAGLQPAAP